MTVVDMTFDDAPSEASAARAYRAAEGRIDRVSVIFFQLDAHGAPDLNRPRLVGAKTQYHKSVGTVISRAGAADADEEIWSACEPARTRYATLVLRYPTTADGRVLSDPSNLTFLPWDFGEITYKRLHELSSEQRPLKRNLGSVDLKITCTNTRKQHVEISVVGPAIWRLKPDAQARLLQRAQTLYDVVSVGRDIPDDELRQRLGLPNRQVVPEIEPVDYDDLIAQV